MDRFLFAYNPLKPAEEYGLQGYIVDTVKNVWHSLTHKPATAETEACHLLQVHIPGATAADSMRSATRAARWYDSWLIQQGKDVNVEILFTPAEGQ